MRTSTLLLRNLTYFWRTNLAVVLGVATAVAVLAGALLVGDSVRASLRDLFLSRLGSTDDVIASTGFFRERLVDDLRSQSGFADEFAGACPLIVLKGFVTHESSGRRASGVQVYGVDDRFWKFHARGGEATTLGERGILVSPDLARELGSEQGETILLRVEKPSAIPAGSLHGRKDDLGRTIRLTDARPLAASALSEFSLRPQQGAVRAVFVSLGRLQKDLDRPGRVNTILLKEKQSASYEPDRDRTANRTARQALIAETLRKSFSIEDAGIKLRVLDERRGVALESETAIIGDALYGEALEVAPRANLKVVPILSYLANAIRLGQREVPYSLVTAISAESFEAIRHDSGYGSGHGPEDQTSRAELPPIVLNVWAARDLGAKRGDEITLEYYLWEDEGRLKTESARFRLDAIVPIKGVTADRDFVPDYPGITQNQNIADWDPPFPVDLKRVRPKDEDYWHRYRTTPKAFVSLETGIKLWQSRHGKFTSLRLRGSGEVDPGQHLETFRKNLQEGLDPVAMGFSVYPVRAEGLEASRGATDFGEYFVYFSFFLVIAALLLASLFFKLGIEQRLREIGILRAVGFPAPQIRSLFLGEGVLLATAGSVLGIAGAIGYGALMMQGLRTWWVGAVGTTSLSLTVSPVSLAIGAAAGIIIALVCIVWTLRGLAHASPTVLLAGNLDAVSRASSRWDGASGKRLVTTVRAAIALSLAGMLLLAGAQTGLVGQTAGFFGAGSTLLGALLCYEYGWLRRGVTRIIRGSGWWPVSRLGFRNATSRPGRSILCIALIASAAFIIVAVDSFKRDAPAAAGDKKSGTGGFPLLAESLFPLYYDPNTPEGRDELGIFAQRLAQKGFEPANVSFARFRVREGDDASCLNLYQPRNPRILAPEDRFLSNGRFSFQASEAETREEKENPWLLLNRDLPDEVVPVIADANSLAYVLHRKLGEQIILNRREGGPVKLRVVGALADSIFQGELLMSEHNFLRLFPEQGGYSFFLLDVHQEAAAAATSALEDQLSEFGFDIVPSAEKLAGFHRVENTYISTFQALGGLGLVLGTLGLGAVLFRNVLERRRELALLRAIGYHSSHFAWMVIAENAVLVCCGLLIGVICAVVAITPALSSRGGHFPYVSLWLLALVMVTGLCASIAATVFALRAPLIPALRAE